MTYTEDDPDWQAVVTPRTPSTAAGRRLVADATDHPIWASAMPGYVLAIEAEARAPLEAEIERLRRIETAARNLLAPDLDAIGRQYHISSTEPDFLALRAALEEPTP